MDRQYFYLGRNRALTRLKTGQPFFVDTADSAITPWIVMHGVWETFADDIVSSYVKPGMTIIDVGANVGYYTVKWGDMVGSQGRVLAVEANPATARLLRENVALNGLAGRCEVHVVAAGVQEGTATLRVPMGNGGGASFIRDVGRQDVADIEVAVMPLDRLFPDLKNVDLIKIDVEGVEPEVLSGARRIIEASPKCAFHIEVHAFWESQYGSVKAVLEPISLNRSIFLMKPNGTIAPVAIDDIADYAAVQPGGIADVFICPAHEDYIWRVSSYMDR